MWEHSDMFKSLIFVQGLTANKDAEIRTRILTSLDRDTNLTLRKVAEECNRIENFRHDTQKIEVREKILNALSTEINKVTEILKILNLFVEDQITKHLSNQTLFMAMDNYNLKRTIHINTSIVLNVVNENI